jgi:hypothetical protein
MNQSKVGKTIVEFGRKGKLLMNQISKIKTYFYKK